MLVQIAGLVGTFLKSKDRKDRKDRNGRRKVLIFNGLRAAGLTIGAHGEPPWEVGFMDQRQVPILLVRVVTLVVESIEKAM